MKNFETPENKQDTPELNRLWSNVYSQFVVKSSSLAKKEADKAVKEYKKRFN